MSPKKNGDHSSKMRDALISAIKEGLGIKDGETWATIDADAEVANRILDRILDPRTVWALRVLVGSKVESPERIRVAPVGAEWHATQPPDGQKKFLFSTVTCEYFEVRSGTLATPRVCRMFKSKDPAAARWEQHIPTALEK